MFSYLYNKFRFSRLRRENEAAKDVDAAPVEEGSTDDPRFSGDLESNLKVITGTVVNSADLICRRFSYGSRQQGRAALIYIDGLVNAALVNENIMKPLMYSLCRTGEENDAELKDIMYAKSALLFVSSAKETDAVNEAIDGFLSGDTLLLVDGSDKALIISLRDWKNRGIEEPETESVVRGPREGFTETLRINTSMLRRKIKNPDLAFETMKLGARTKTDVCVAYIRGLADPALIEEVKRRLGRINTDAILESGYIEQFIEDEPASVFSTVANSEKPDKVAAKMLEGRVAILVDGTPFVLTVPMLFIESIQSSEDYYARPLFASLIRLVRVAALFLSVVAPALYVALSTFHQELIPTPLLLTMASAHEGVPFPAVLEAAVMIITFEILKEAGVRLPRPIGQAVSIVGALVIGQAAVSAGLIGAPMVIVVAITAVASFVVPPQTDSSAVVRFALLILAGFMGGFGIAIGLLATFIHMASLRSFGTPYLSPLAPFNRGDMKDAFIRAPSWVMKKRPRDIPVCDTVRQGPDQRPGPPKEGAAQ